VLIKIEDIRREPEVQLRTGLDMDRVNAMVEFESEGGKLPPVTVVGDDNLLADGHHRVYAAERSGRREVEANREAGGMAEAIAIALNRNDSAQTQPLTRDQRNAGIKALIGLGWSLTRIAKDTGISKSTVSNIGRLTEERKTLSPEVNKALRDTTVLRITSLPEEQRKPFAAKVASAGLAEPRVREAIKAMKADPTLSPEAAVDEVTPRPTVRVTGMETVAKQVRTRLKDFIDEKMTVDGTEYDFWAVLDVLAAHLRDGAFAGDLHAEGLANLLSEVAVKAENSADALRNATSLSSYVLIPEGANA
jgi:ParB-like chromosome segregation protein Spo0J